MTMIAPHTAMLVAVLTATMVFTVPAADTAPAWHVVQRVREEVTGQPHYSFSDAIDAAFRVLVVGSPTSARGRGEVRVYNDHGSGYKLFQVLTDPKGVIGDDFGAAVAVDKSASGLRHIVVGAPGANKTGAAYVYVRRTLHSRWELGQILNAPRSVGTEVERYGRHVFVDKFHIIVSGVSTYRWSPRFHVSAVNVKGTRFFIESTGIDNIACDPLYVYAPRLARRNATNYQLFQTLRDGDPMSDFGASVSLSGNHLIVGAPFREDALYGHGTDGDLIVENGAVAFLQSQHDYNFANVHVKAGGLLTVAHYDPLDGNGGILLIRAKFTFTVDEGGVVNVTARGYKGGNQATELNPPANGEFDGGGQAATSRFVGINSCDHDGSTTTVASQQALTKINASSGLQFAEANGGGGGYGSRGKAGTPVQCGESGRGGFTYGDEELTSLLRGSGGGSGQPWKIGTGGSGGDGGGAIRIVTREFTNRGSVVANGGGGGDGGYYSGAGGGGSGGSIHIRANVFVNDGIISAIGGQGGFRASGSGSGGDGGVTGGQGGDGRIKVDVVTARSTGTIIPVPFNVTTFTGAVHIYDRIASDVAGGTARKWTYRSALPRFPQSMFIGHSVLLDGPTLAWASSEKTGKNPREHVYFTDIAHIQNNTYRTRDFAILRPSDPDDRLFGYRMAMSNDTLLLGVPNIQSEGTGGVHLYHRSPTVAHGWVLREILKGLNEFAPTAYGLKFLHLDYPLMFISSDVQDDRPAPNPRRSEGCVVIRKNSQNITTSTSFVTCEFTTVTANTTVNCELHTRDRLGRPAGEIIDATTTITHPKNVEFVHIGLYKWTEDISRYDVQVGNHYPTHNVHAVIHGELTPSLALTVTPPVEPQLSNVTCQPVQIEAGHDVTCTIHTNADSGEESALQYMSTTVYNIDDAFPHLAAGDVVNSSKGWFAAPKPVQNVSEDPLGTDFYNIATTEIKFQRRGVYTFKFMPPRNGTYAVLAKYQNIPLGFPNPFVVEAQQPIMSPYYSRVDCPNLAAPNRTAMCVIYLRSQFGSPAGRSEMQANFSNPHNSRVVGGSVHHAVDAKWIGMGRVALLFRPCCEGSLTVQIKFNDITIPPTDAFSGSIDVRNRYGTKCAPVPVVQQSRTLLAQAAASRSDPIRWGAAIATDAEIIVGKGMCEDTRV